MASTPAPASTAHRYYAVGTAPTTVSRAAKAVAQAAVRIVGWRSVDGTWGGPDSLDRFIATCHAEMTLMAAGVPPDAPLLAPGLTYLDGLNVDRITTFFWRSGPFLNIQKFDSAVRHDIQYLTNVRVRAGGNPSYPATFFLLKLMRFSAHSADYADQIPLVTRWILDDFSAETCWLDRTSITSMGLALMADLKGVPSEVIQRSAEYLLGRFHRNNDGRHGFSDNIIDDAFTVYNLCERWEDIRQLIPKDLWDAVRLCEQDLIGALEAFESSPPPFGGSVDAPTYGVSVLARAIMACESTTSSLFDEELAHALVAGYLETLPKDLTQRSKITGFWGDVNIRSDGHCFVIMPFSPERRTEIYEEYVKAPIESELKMRCIRADDIFISHQIMHDVWEQINKATVIVADLSDRNPNVFYELGLAHALGKPVVTIVEDGKDLPFDISPVRTVIYGDSPKSWRSLAVKVVKAVQAALVPGEA